MKNRNWELPPETLDRIRAFADQHGPDWRNVLRDMWMTGADTSQPDGHLLRAVRNRIGPSGLEYIHIFD